MRKIRFHTEQSGTAEIIFKDNELKNTYYSINLHHITDDKIYSTNSWTGGYECSYDTLLKPEDFEIVKPFYCLIHKERNQIMYCSSSEHSCKIDRKNYIECNQYKDTEIEVIELKSIEQIFEIKQKNREYYEKT